MSNWFDPELIGTLILQWSGRAVAALGIPTTNLLAILGAAGLALKAVHGDLLERIKAALESHGLPIPYPQRALHIVDRTNGGV
jgi:small-conductance mechanosensitive channel